jgi:hypothetical protein
MPQRVFLVTGVEPADKQTRQVRAVNYSEHYYANDQDYANAVIGRDGYGRAGGHTQGDGTGFPAASANMFAAEVSPDTEPGVNTAIGLAIPLGGTTPDFGNVLGSLDLPTPVGRLAQCFYSWIEGEDQFFIAFDNNSATMVQNDWNFELYEDGVLVTTLIGSDASNFGASTENATWVWLAGFGDENIYVMEAGREYRVQLVPV